MKQLDGTVHDCVVVGGGPAGLTAALYLRRFRRSVRVLCDGESRARRIPSSNNYPGFPQGVPGDELLDRMESQLVAVGGEVANQRAASLAITESGLQLVTDSGLLTARKVLLATGVRDIVPGLDGVDEVRAHGLLRQCPICDGFEYADRRIGVIGSGWHGVRETQFLRTYSSNLVYMPQGDDLTPEMRAELMSCGATVAARAQRLAIDVGGGVRIDTGNGTAQQVDVLYVALGSAPRSELAAMAGAGLDDNGNIFVDMHCRTSVDNLFAAGDVVVGLDQLAVAIGHAAIAATTIHNELRKQR